LAYLDEVPSCQGDFIKSAKTDIDKTKDRERVEYWGFPHLYEKYKSIFHGYFNERLQRIMQYNPKMNSMFDVGCGYGYWMKFCQNKGFQVNGLDASKEAISHARTVLDLNAQKTTLEDYRFDRGYDAIVMCDLLEHLSDPNKELKKISQALNKDGIFFVQVPNLLGFKLPPFHGFGLPFHIWQFDKSSLSKLLNKNGFKVLRWWTGVMGVIGVYESGGPSLYQKGTWNLARLLRIGNRLMAVAKKT
jgi:2-polyprenyl-3-methyl-5-hydroxy-6-metoxy-1,4-benzoquinol methylase